MLSMVQDKDTYLESMIDNLLALILVSFERIARTAKLVYQQYALRSHCAHVNL